MKYLRNPLILFSGLLLTVWLFQQFFLRFSEEENIPIFSHHKKGNRALADFLRELKVPLTPLFAPIYEWQGELSPPNNQNYRYIVAEPPDDSEFIFWHSAEMKYYRDFLEQGNHMVIFTDDPTLYWAAFFLPPNPITAEKKIIGQTNTAIALSSGIELETDAFLWENLSSTRPLLKSAMAVKEDTAMAHQCNIPSVENTFLLTTRYAGYASAWDEKFTEAGWSLLEKCANAHNDYYQKWKAWKGTISFISTRDIVQNNLISEGRNINLLAHVLKVDSGNKILWDEYHRGVFREPNLWYYITQTFPGKTLLWIACGILLIYFFKNRKLRRFAVRKPRGKITASAVVRYEDLAATYKDQKIMEAAYDTLQKIQKMKKKRLKVKQTTDYEEMKSALLRYSAPKNKST